MARIFSAVALLGCALLANSHTTGLNSSMCTDPYDLEQIIPSDGAAKVADCKILSNNVWDLAHNQYITADMQEHVIGTWNSCQFVARTVEYSPGDTVTIGHNDIRRAIAAAVGTKSPDEKVYAYGFTSCTDTAAVEAGSIHQIVWFVQGTPDFPGDDTPSDKSTVVARVANDGPSFNVTFPSRDAAASTVCDRSYAWNDQTSEFSPSVSDCKKIQSQVNPATEYKFASGGNQITIAEAGTCRFAAASEDLVAGDTVLISGQDIIDNIQGLIQDGDGNVKAGQVGGWGRQYCSSERWRSVGKIVKIKWWIYHP
ncbi:hypothetical protein QBC42DRAFT_286531 [Cladorrhinum samala]|uniref:Ecp2 effector protein-like domain-containing protein n=1 Tax=Cladorrhinum samala TaxID=585594 RepID=A0AAV9HNU0_9PEZI|nr:hypothetical protein QBC42DRAFT_286531 [Cladorrhinum samala]